MLSISLFEPSQVLIVNLNAHTDYFDSLFDGRDDPWGFKTRWYEQRKRAITLAALPRARYASAYEPGCANGELSAALADRCDQLLVSDGNARALSLADARLAALPHVRVLKAWLPHDWPPGPFDLIVISEVGYYLDAFALGELADRARQCLSEHGTVLACHWKAPIEGCALTGSQVHDQLGQRLDIPHLLRVDDPDFLLDIWCFDTMSAAQAEGLRKT